MKTIKTNYSVSNRVLLATFDKNWDRSLSDGVVLYTAKSNDSEVELTLQGIDAQTLIFQEGQRILVIGGTFHFPPHEYYRNPLEC
ncbi:hypothetical protein N5C46_10520 [Rossellomorea vietnamensis]|uniref:Uncharacterized protein n=1 Tax=Rossellomorea vietnamensis TaxID=218284 RepID=A0ACD4CDG4_9BACI|nr:hypothetical protein [Rossellomorea vietnamensis]UXH46449.1 hypothetical protein N5C46_10520 [Rossellomorea vietnamensis]